MAADQVTDGVSDFGLHSYAEAQAHRVARSLVDALAVEGNPAARESMLNALAALTVWGLAPSGEVRRALALPRHDADLAQGHWTGIEEWAAHHGP